MCVCVWCRVGNGRQRALAGGLRVGAGQVALAIAGQVGLAGRLLGHLRAGSGAAGAEAGRHPGTREGERPLIEVPHGTAADASKRTYLMIPATGPRVSNGCYSAQEIRR